MDSVFKSFVCLVGEKKHTPSLASSPQARGKCRSKNAMEGPGVGRSLCGLSYEDEGAVETPLERTHSHQTLKDRKDRI